MGTPRARGGRNRGRKEPIPVAPGRRRGPEALAPPAQTPARGAAGIPEEAGPWLQDATPQRGGGGAGARSPPPTLGTPPVGAPSPISPSPGLPLPRPHSPLTPPTPLGQTAQAALHGKKPSAANLLFPASGRLSSCYSVQLCGLLGGAGVAGLGGTAKGRRGGPEAGAGGESAVRSPRGGEGARWCRVPQHGSTWQRQALGRRTGPVHPPQWHQDFAPAAVGQRPARAGHRRTRALSLPVQQQETEERLSCSQSLPRRVGPRLTAPVLSGASPAAPPPVRHPPVIICCAS